MFWKGLCKCNWWSKKLTIDDILFLPAGTAIIVTWSGGNGAWIYIFINLKSKHFRGKGDAQQFKTINDGSGFGCGYGDFKGNGEHFGHGDCKGHDNGKFLWDSGDGVSHGFWKLYVYK